MSDKSIFRRAKEFAKFFRKHLYLSILFSLFVAVVCILPVKTATPSAQSLIKAWAGYGGYCTDWVYARWKEVHPSEELLVNGDAWEWYGYAQNHGMSIGATPQFGAVAVWDQSAAGKYGHVAFVEQVHSSSYFRVSEMNWSCGRWCRDDRNVTLTPDIRFIYPRNQQQITACNEYDRCKGVGPDVYFIERGKKRLIPNPDTLRYLNNHFGGDVKVVTDEQLSKYPSGRGVPSSTWYYTTDYVLVKSVSSEWTYVMSSGVKRYLFSYDQIDPGDGDFYYPSDVRVLSESEFNSIPYGPALYWDGQLLASTTLPEVYVIEKNKKRLIPNYQTLIDRGYKSEDIFHIPQEAVNSIAVGRGVPSSTWHYTTDNVLVRGTSSDWTYVMKDGQKRYIFSHDQTDPDGDFYYPSDLRVLSDAEINDIPTGVPMTWDKQMIRGRGSLGVYVIERDKKRHLPDLNTLLSRGLKPEDIVDIPQGIVDMFPTGRTVPDVSLPNTSDAILLQEAGSSKVWVMRNEKRNLLRSLDDVDPLDGDFYYSSDIRIVDTLEDVPVQPLDLPLSLSVSKIYWGSYADYQAKQLSVDYIIKNTGENDAYEVTVTESNNTKDVMASTALPILVGDIPKGEQGVLTVKYYVPTGTARFRANIIATARDFNEFVHTYP